MYAYKGFEPDLSCRGYRFVMGKNVTLEANCASNGFHCAEDPLDCLSYYGDMNRSIYCLVQPGGDIDEDDRDSKIACTELTILRRLTRKEFFLHALAYMVDHPGRKVSDKVQREHSTSRNGYAIVRGKTPAACGKLGDTVTLRCTARMIWNLHVTTNLSTRMKITGLAAAGRPTSPMHWSLTAVP